MTNKLSLATEGLVDIFLAAVNLFLGLRFILRLFAANQFNPFVAFVYNSTSTLLKPFNGIFPVGAIVPGYVFEFSTLLAMIVYSLAASLVLKLLLWLDKLLTTPPTPTNQPSQQ